MSMRKKSVARRRAILKESAEKIFQLRAALGKTQGEFAKMFKGASRESVSAWEKSRALPTAEKYFEMAIIALKLGKSEIDYRWFFGQAGVDHFVLYKLSKAFVVDIERNKKSALRPEGVFNVPLINDVRHAHEPILAPAKAIERHLPLPSEVSSNDPAKVFCVRIPSNLSSLACPPLYDFLNKQIGSSARDIQKPELSAPIFQKGDIAIVDSSIKDVCDLAEQIVALSFSVQLKYVSTESLEERWSEPVLHVGWLRHFVTTKNPLLSEQRKLQAKLLEKAGLPIPSDQSLTEHFYYLFPSPEAPGREYASLITTVTTGTPELIKEYKILGKVVGWIAQKGKK